MADLFYALYTLTFQPTNQSAWGAHCLVLLFTMCREVIVI